MLRKLFSCLLPQSKHASSLGSLDDVVDAVDTWAASLPIDLFLEILLRLEPAAVVCCAGVCKPWRRVIIDNVSILGPHLDGFFGPTLLLGTFHYDVVGKTCLQALRRTPGPFQSALRIPSKGAGAGGRRKRMPPANSLLPAAAFAALPMVLSSKDGFILLQARSINLLCLCNPVTGYCTIIPATGGWRTKYILLSAAASSSPSEPPAVWILAVHRRDYNYYLSLDEGTVAYQTFSTSGDKAWVWSPVVQSSGDELVMPAGRLCVWTDDRRTVVCQDAVVYWLAGPETAVVTCVFARPETAVVTCVFGLDVRTGRTWITELSPRQSQQHRYLRDDPEASSSILATSGDGQRLSLIRRLWGPSIQVWVLSDNANDVAQWTLHRTISIDARDDVARSIYLSAFCPRSRCVVAVWSDYELLIDIESSGRIRRIGKIKGFVCCPYEIDSSSSFISKMKHL